VGEITRCLKTAIYELMAEKLAPAAFSNQKIYLQMLKVTFIIYIPHKMSSPAGGATESYLMLLASTLMHLCVQDYKQDKSKFKRE